MGQPVRVCHTDKKQNRGFTMTNIFSTGLITMLLSNHISSEPSWQQKKSLECETCGEDQYTCADCMLVATLPLELENDKDLKHRGRLWDYLLLGGAPFQNITLSTKTRRAAEGGAPSETNTSTVSSGSLLAAGEPPSESGSHGWGRKCCPWGSKGLPWSGSRVLKNLVWWYYRFRCLFVIHLALFFVITEGNTNVLLTGNVSCCHWPPTGWPRPFSGKVFCKNHCNFR